MRWYAVIAVLFWSIPNCFSHPLTEDSSAVIGAFQDASAFSVSPSGTIYVLDQATNEILKISTSGEVLARTGGFGSSQESFAQPADIVAANDLRVYVADYGNQRIEYFDGNLNYISTLQLQDSPDPDQRFGYPKSVAMDRFGSLYITDGENLRIVKIVTAAPNAIDRTIGGIDAGQGAVHSPSRVRVTGNDVVVVQDSSTILEYDISGNFLRTITIPPTEKLRRFAVTDSAFYLLDSCSVISLRGDDMEKHQIPQSCSAVDIAAQGDRFYLLTRENIVVMPVSTLFSSSNTSR